MLVTASRRDRGYSQKIHLLGGIRIDICITARRFFQEHKEGSKPSLYHNTARIPRLINRFGTYPGGAAEASKKRPTLSPQPSSSARPNPSRAITRKYIYKMIASRKPHLRILDRVQQVFQVFPDITPSPPQHPSKIVTRAERKHSQWWPLLLPSNGIHGLGNPR